MKKITAVILLFGISIFGKTVSALPVHNEIYTDTSFTDTAKIKNSITLLGVYHFENPNLDAFNVKSDNVMSPKRQREIQQLVEELAKFKPTQIDLEFDVAKSDADKRYQRYLKGEYELGPGEGEQIGFRLAKLLGHPHIYPVDERNIELDFDPGDLAKDFGPLLEELGKAGNAAVSMINDWVKNNAIGVALSKMNAPEIDRLNVDLYYRYLLPVGRGDKNPGPEGVARWYKRNLYILHHIISLLKEGEENRVLVIFGQGHTAMLNQFLQYTTLFKKEDIRQYLPKAD